MSTDAAEAPQAAEVPPSQSPGRKAWLGIGVFLVLINMPLIHRFLIRGRQPVVATVPFQDDFSSDATIAKNYWTTGGLWRTRNGELYAPGVKNNPLWLQASLPRDVAVEFDVRSESPEGDIKVELFGDGLNHSSGYVLIHGGWNNSISIISRLDEHGTSLAALETKAAKLAKEKGLAASDVVSTGVFKKDTRMRKEANPFPVQVGKTYHWRIERKGARLSWFIDGQPFMDFEDPFPLEGPDHDRFGFSSWEANLFFDNLVVTPL